MWLFVCLFVYNALTFENIAIESSVLARLYTSSEYLGQVHISRSSGQGRRHSNIKACLHVFPGHEWLALGPLLGSLIVFI